MAVQQRNKDPGLLGYLGRAMLKEHGEGNRQESLGTVSVPTEGGRPWANLLPCELSRVGETVPLIKGKKEWQGRRKMMQAANKAGASAAAVATSAAIMIRKSVPQPGWWGTEEGKNNCASRENV